MAKIDITGDTVRVIQFTDTHLFATDEGRLLGVDTFSSFEQVVAMAREQRPRPDLVLLTGDLVQEETEESYRRVAALVTRIDAPVFYLPGNHDDTKLMKTVLSSLLPDGEGQGGIKAGSWNIVLLNSTVPGKVGGFLEQAELSRLDSLLSGLPESHALVCLHHHPVPVGSAWIDGLGLSNAEAFFAIIDRHPQVRGILWGHIHQHFEQQLAGKLLMATPSTCVQFKPLTSGFTLDTRLPGYRWLELSPDGTITSEVSRLEGVSTGVDMTASGY